MYFPVPVFEPTSSVLLGKCVTHQATEAFSVIFFHQTPTFSDVTELELT